MSLQKLPGWTTHAQRIAQTAAILQYLGPRLGLVPEDEDSRLRAHQLKLTIMDFAAEAHDVHHPIASSLYYEQQKAEALRRAPIFVNERMPKFFRYFDHALEKHLERGVPVSDHSLLALTAEEPPALVGETLGAYVEFARLLGRRTAELHVALASRDDDPAFAPEAFTGFYSKKGVKVTIAGTKEGGAAKAESIEVDDNGKTTKAESIDKLPKEYQELAKSAMKAIR